MARPFEGHLSITYLRRVWAACMRLFGQHKGKYYQVKIALPGAFLAVLSTFDRRLYITGWHGAASAPCILSGSSVPDPVPGCPNRSCKNPGRWHKRKGRHELITASFLRLTFRLLQLPGGDRNRLPGFDLPC